MIHLHHVLVPLVSAQNPTSAAAECDGHKGCSEQPPLLHNGPNTNGGHRGATEGSVAQAHLTQLTAGDTFQSTFFPKKIKLDFAHCCGAEKINTLGHDPAALRQPGCILAGLTES